MIYVIKKDGTREEFNSQKIVNADPLGTLDYNSSQGRNRQTYKKTFEAPAAKVLVVDDNDMNLLVVKKLLRAT